MGSLSSDRTLEMHFPDEDRVFLAARLERCPLCGSAANLVRKIRKPKGAWTFQFFFSVTCDRLGCQYQQTPLGEFGSSHEAVRVWQLNAKLVKP